MFVKEGDIDRNYFSAKTNSLNGPFVILYFRGMALLLKNTGGRILRLLRFRIFWPRSFDGSRTIDG